MGSTIDIVHLAGLLVIAISAIRGWKKGFVNTIGSILASVLAVVFVYILNTWALEALLINLWKDHMLVIVRILLCVGLYMILFLIMKAILISMKVLAKIPVIRGLNKLLGFFLGGVYGVLLVGIGYWIYSWFV